MSKQARVAVEGPGVLLEGNQENSMIHDFEGGEKGGVCGGDVG